MENVERGDQIDLLKFPVPRWHEGDGGRYLGTAHLVITRDPETGVENVGCYRVMLQDKDKVGLYISPGKHGKMHYEKAMRAESPFRLQWCSANIRYCSSQRPRRFPSVLTSTTGLAGCLVSR